jgi:hypothetical protein
LSTKNCLIQVWIVWCLNDTRVVGLSLHIVDHSWLCWQYFIILRMYIAFTYMKKRNILIHIEKRKIWTTYNMWTKSCPLLEIYLYISYKTMWFFFCLVFFSFSWGHFLFIWINCLPLNSEFCVVSYSYFHIIFWIVFFSKKLQVQHEEYVPT